jgi:hypothetical protein
MDAIIGEQIQANFGVRPPEHTLLMSSITREANLIAAEMYMKVILIQLVIPSDSSAISFTDFIYPYCCTRLSARSIFLDYTILQCCLQTFHLINNCCPQFLAFDAWSP